VRSGRTSPSRRRRRTVTTDEFPETVRGLSNYGIDQRAIDARQLRTIVETRSAYVNPDGFAGNGQEGGCDTKLPAPAAAV